MNKEFKEKAHFLDEQDGLKIFREQFFIPKHDNSPYQDKKVVYFTGNSLGLQPIRANDYIQVELDAWKEYGVEGHFMGKNPWMYYHKMFANQLADLVGGLPKEVVAMNTLTTNLHLLMVSFYRPTSKKFKIIMEGGAFPSDQYAMESQVRFHGFDPSEAIIEVFPENGKSYLETSQILEAIELNKDSLALVMFSGVNYYSGQVFDMESISKKAREIDCLVGFDLAHAAGNVEMKLHDWEVDFACWCSYKYLNSGPGGVSGVFIHEKHHKNNNIPRFAGWWGHDETTRFKMKKGFIPMESAEGWQLSNAQIFPMAIHKASLDIISEAGGMKAMAQKRNLLSDFAFECLNSIEGQDSFKIITPNAPRMKGAQLSIVCLKHGKAIFNHLQENGIICDWREPDVIRIAPVPLYNSFMDIYHFVQIFENALLNETLIGSSAKIKVSSEN